MGAPLLRYFLDIEIVWGCMKRTDFFSGISGSGADTFIFWKDNIAKSEMSWLIIIRPMHDH